MTMKIQKLDPQDVYSKIDVISISAMAGKIDELVDAVNWLGKSETEIRPENTNTYELYLKNKHLIGKLCKFKCAGGYCYGLLTNIKRKPCQWPFESLGRAFSTCEPVKPDDDIIYQGE